MFHAILRLNAKADIGMSIAFLCILFAIGITWHGTIPIGGMHADLLLPVAVLAGITDGWILAILSGIVWASTRTCIAMSQWIMLAINITTIAAAKLSYDYSRRQLPSNRYCPYYSLIVASAIHVLLCVAVLQAQNIATIAWQDIVLTWGIELAFGSAFFILVLKKLREHHILNGIKEHNTASMQ